MVWTNVVLLEQVELDYKSRVSSISAAISMAAIPAMNFLLGGICELVGIPVIFGVSGLLIVLAFLLFSRRRSLRAL